VKETIKKKLLRQKAKKLREKLYLPELSQKIVERISAWPLYQNAKHILTYSAFASEIDLKALNKDNKSFYLTRTNNDLNLSIHSLNSKQEKHKYGYWQPVAGLEPIPPNTIDLVLVPGLAFAIDGSRLGYGKGYYDRLLADAAHKSECLNIGVCFDFQLVDSLPHEPWDIAMDMVVAENSISRNPNFKDRFQVNQQSNANTEKRSI